MEPKPVRPNITRPARPPELAAVVALCRRPLAGVACVSGVVNLLYLTGSFFMLQVYDRVIPSRSVPTLLGLAALACVLYFFQGLLDVLRSRVLVRVGGLIDARLTARAYEITAKLPLLTGGASVAPLRDLDQIRSFASSGGPAAFFDLPWMPLYLAICFAFHPLIGMLTTLGGAALIAITFCTEALTRAPVKAAASASAERQNLVEASRRNAEVLKAMGMRRSMLRLWTEVNDRQTKAQVRAADVAGGLGGLSKVLRMLLQSAVLGLGAFLVIRQEASGGVIIASSILTARALAPVEQVIAHWKSFIGARQSWSRLGQAFALLPESAAPLALPAPREKLSVAHLAVAAPGGQRALLQDVTFEVGKGSAIGVIGPSGSGKSSLARALVGAWTAARGAVTLDGAPLTHWPEEDLGRHIGYLPQDVELFAGSVARNIARFDPDVEPAAVLKAAKSAGVHELIMQLPDGYGTQIGEGGAALSGGQRQRIALARALYNDPFLVLLDEPNSNLDAEGEEALTRAIQEVKARQGVVVIIAHRPSALAAVDKLLVMREGRVQDFGDRDEVLSKFARRAPGSHIQVVRTAEAAS